MLNAALLGGAEARNALQNAMFDDDLPQVDTDWCVGGCKSWNETDEGKSRMALLRELMLQWAKDNPLEYRELRGRQIMVEHLLAYITVLGVKEVTDKLSRDDLTCGANHVMGCLHHLTDALEQREDDASQHLLGTIRHREYLNGTIHDVNDEKLVASTRRCAQECLEYLRENFN